MALSNWDTLAVDEEGQSTNGVIVAPSGVSVEIYKNWLYVSDKNAWVEHGRFCSPTVMQVNDGNIQYKDVSIIARRGPQQGIFCVVTAKKYDKETKTTTRHCMAGIGCYGFHDHDWVGVTSESKLELLKLIKDAVENYCMDQDVADKISGNLDSALRFNQGDAYLAQHLDMPVPATAVGQQEQPLVIQALSQEKGPSTPPSS